jgi:hypothetical protein
MATTVHLDQEQIKDYQVICNVDEQTLREVVARLKALPVAPTPFNKLIEAISDALPGNEEAVESIFRQMAPVVGWVRQEQSRVPELMAGVRHALTVTDGWDSQKWSAIESILTELFSLRIIYLSASAVDLSFEHVNLFRGARILTDIRPIFNEEASAIEGSVITHTLRLRFENTQGRHELTFALEEPDVTKIAEQCERAISKAKLARSLMAQKAEIPTIISGGIDNE